MKKYKNKKQRIQEKRIKIKNKKLIKQWAFLKPYNVWTGKPLKHYNYEFTWADDMPRGWRKAFGDLMFEEIDEVLKRTHTSIYIEQIKEKFGQLRFYCQAHQDIQEIINTYSTLSENICISCGKPDVPMINTGWIHPKCKECFEHNQKSNKWAPKGKYEDHVISEYKMASTRNWSCYDPEKKEWVKYSKGISETANKIRARYYKENR